MMLVPYTVKLLRACVATGLAGAAILTQAQALKADEIFNKVSPSVWQVKVFDLDGMPVGGGSAVFVTNEHALTNCHVLSNAAAFELRQGSQSTKAALQYWDAERDMCLVLTDKKDGQPVRVAAVSTLSVGQSVYALGTPRGLEHTLSVGLVSSLRRAKADPSRIETIQTDAAISPGSSGGGLFNDRGELVGITTYLIRGDASQNLNFAIPASDVHQLSVRHAAALKSAAAGQPDHGASKLPTTVAVRAYAPRVIQPPHQLPIRRQLHFPVPHLGPAGQAAYAESFLKASHPRAFAVSRYGAWGMGTGLQGTQDSQSGDAQSQALAQCERAAHGSPCVIYVIDDTVLYQPPPAL